MKKLIFILLLFSGLTMAQNNNKFSFLEYTEKEILATVGNDSTDALRIVLTNTSGSEIDTLPVNVQGVTLSADSLVLKSNTTVGSFTMTIDTSATVLTSQSSRIVEIVNDDETATIRVGGSGVTTSTGIPLRYWDVYRARLTNTDKLYVISDKTNTNIDVIYKR